MAHTQSMPASVPAQDSISRNFRQIFARDPAVRRYTVSAGMHNIRETDGRSERAPMLRLEGAWLKRAGFAIGRAVTIQVSEGRLVIELAEPERVPQTEALARIARVADGDFRKRELDRLARELKRRRRHR